jgi:acyl-CoA reductase-like NAD-dependent aldehyde dehydrogenase
MAVVELEPRVRDLIGGSHRLLIGGDWVEASSGETFETINPATEEVLARVARGSAQDVDRAVRAARAAFEDGSPWRRMTPSERGRLIHRIGDLILEHADELAMLESLDNGKSYVIARHADIVLAADLFHYMSGWVTKIEGNTIPISAVPAPGEYLAFTLREPVGVVGQIIPWNFPLLMAAWKLGPALAAGCTVVLKPAEQTPLSALRLGELLLEAGLPPGVVNIVTGFGEEAGAPLAAHPGVDKVAFTGSTEVGRLIVRAAAGNLKKVSLELGGTATAGGGRVGDRGYFVAPTVLTNTTPDMQVQREEIFGPVVTAVPFDDPAEIVPIANDTNYGLAAGVFTRDVSKAYRTAQRLRAGTVWINTYHVFDAAMPFGGYKESGWGREMGHNALANYLETKSVVTQLA